MSYNPTEARNPKGEWTSGGAPDGSGLPPLTLPEFHGIGAPEYVRDHANAIAKDMGFDPGRIDISEDKPTFELNGKTYNTGGIAEIGKPEGEGRVVLYRQNVKASDLDGVIVHEIEHMKVQKVFNARQAENTAISNDPGPAPDPDSKYWWGKKGGIDAVMSPSGSLHGDYVNKYPVYSAMHEALDKYNMDKFAAGDGVSSYSLDWWQAYKAGKASSFQAIHETLAEMARMKRETGKFPSHMGPRVLSYRGVDTPHPSKASIAEGEKLWRNLYRTVEKYSK